MGVTVGASEVQGGGPHANFNISLSVSSRKPAEFFVKFPLRASREVPVQGLGLMVCMHLA